MRYLDLLELLTRRLGSAPLHYGHGAATAQDEAWYLLAALSDIEPASLPLNQPVPALLAEQALQLVEERLRTRKPMAYLTGAAWFYGLPLHCSEQVLVPRSPIGELLHGGLESWLQAPPRHIVDVGTGSGSLAITAALCFPHSRVTALDLADAALALAARNIERHDLQRRVRVERSDGLSACAGRRYDLILSNPPYVPWQEYLTLPPEYWHEPRLALLSPDNGLAFTRGLLREAGRHLTEDGVLVVEVGNSEYQLMTRWPDFPAEWPEFQHGGGGVFIIGARELAQWRQAHPAL